MTGKGKDRRGHDPAARGAPDQTRDEARDARLGAALRQNLLRRKARARALRGPDDQGPDDLPGAPAPPAKDP